MFRGRAGERKRLDGEPVVVEQMPQDYSAANGRYIPLFLAILLNVSTCKRYPALI
jgi:hypothetical protein